MAGTQVEIQGLKSGLERSPTAKKLRQARAEREESDYGPFRCSCRALGGANRWR